MKSNTHYVLLRTHIIGSWRVILRERTPRSWENLGHECVGATCTTSGFGVTGRPTAVGRWPLYKALFSSAFIAYHPKAPSGNMMAPPIRFFHVLSIKHLLESTLLLSLENDQISDQEKSSCVVCVGCGITRAYYGTRDRIDSADTLNDDCTPLKLRATRIRSKRTWYCGNSNCAILCSWWIKCGSDLF